MINKLKRGYITFTKVKIVAEGKEVTEDGKTTDITITEEILREGMGKKMKNILDPTCPIDAMLATVRQVNFDRSLRLCIVEFLMLKDRCE